MNPRFATISRLSNAAVLVRLRIDMEDRGGRMELLLPYATLEPVRELLLQQFMGEKFGRDIIWETHLAEELWNTEVELDVVLDEQMMRLSDVCALQPGSRIVLNTELGAPVLVRCGAVPLFEGRSAGARAASRCASNATCRASWQSDDALSRLAFANTPRARMLPWSGSSKSSWSCCWRRRCFTPCGWSARSAC